MNLIGQNNGNLVVLFIIVKFIKGDVIDFRDNHGNTLLHIASKNGWIHSVEAMIYKEVAHHLRIIKNKGKTITL